MKRKAAAAEIEDAATGLVDPQEAARSVGLVYVSDDLPGIGRTRSRGGFDYHDAAGRPIEDPQVLERVRKLAIPPAYEDVWICADPNGHIQATGRDAKGRKQYRYHPAFRAVRDSTKYEHMLDFAHALPGIRARIEQDMRRHGLPREKVLATIVHLLEHTMIRVGNEDYAKQNKSYGLTTLQSRHVGIEGAELRFAFKGKSGKQWRLRLKDRRVARIVKASQDLPGQHLFQYLDEDGARHDISSGDVNEYLKEIAQRDVTAKDFRTWTGTVLAALALNESGRFDSQAAAKRNIRAAIETVAARLGNTPTICRKCYIHPAVLNGYLADELVLEAQQESNQTLCEEIATLRPEETLVLAFLRRTIG